MSESHKPRVAIVMKRESIGTFFQIEAEFCGFACEICTTPPQTPSSYDLILIDPSVGYCLHEDDSCYVIATVEATPKKPLSWANEVWELPVSIEIVRDLFERIKLRGVSAPGENREAAKMIPNALYLVSREEGRILYRNQTIVLTPSEMTLLCALAEAEGKSVSESVLRERIGVDRGNQVAVHLCNLRKKLEKVSTHRLIETRRGLGYALVEPLVPLE